MVKVVKLTIGIQRSMPLFLGIGITFIFLNITLNGEKLNFSDASTLGAETTSVMSSFNGHRIHCEDSRDAGQCIEGALLRSQQNKVLWLGNSQLHSINQFRLGDNNAPALLFKLLRDSKIDLVTFSQSNANLQEHLVLMEYLTRKLPIKFLILPLVFDDTREEGLRAEVADFMFNLQTSNALQDSEIGIKLKKTKHPIAASMEEPTTVIINNYQEQVENKLNIFLEMHSKLWAARPNIRGQLMNGLYVIRNTFLGITPSSKRKKIPGRYFDNIEALKQILISASKRNITVLMYTAPIRGDVEVPYEISEYAEFKNEIVKLAKDYDAIYLNLEDLVPPQFWGSKDSTTGGVSNEIDFMHFQGGGHLLLSEKLNQAILSAWHKKGFN